MRIFSLFLFGAILACQPAQQESTETASDVDPYSFGSAIVQPDTQRLPRRIAFGSCADQNRPQPILRHVVDRQAELFIYLGDNIYGDTEEMSVLQAKYQMLADKPEFQALRAAMPTVAVWDDHDYGANDAGRHYPKKDSSKAMFMDFWGVPATSLRRQHPGIYGSHMFEENGQRLQLILLDTRTFRDHLLPNDGQGDHKNDYRPNPNPDSTVLGEAQWAWLETQLQEPADLRIIASSIQFGHSYNGWESWTNIPHEQQRFLDLIARTRANGVVFISGDVHWGEISRREPERMYPLYDVTASGINQDWDKIEPNTYRVGDAVAEYNVGMMEVDWEARRLTLLSIDQDNRERNRVEVALDSLRF
ncbi:MAG: alkaline phosphatase family protein [Bacteroidetes bacterium]|nr:MAG: alkaline phosphatase family protein [Bacteroidota bacterium]